MLLEESQDNPEKRKNYSSHQWRAYEYFERKNEQLNDEGINMMFNNALHKMSVMLVIIVNEVNFGQIYMWLQEKSLFGMGALLHNPSPGEHLTGKFTVSQTKIHLLLQKIMKR